MISLQRQSHRHRWAIILGISVLSPGLDVSAVLTSPPSNARLSNFVGSVNGVLPPTAYAQLGSGWVRLSRQFNWSEIEKAKGTFDWGVTDAAVRVAQQNGVQVVANLGSTPAWANGNKGFIFGPAKRSDWTEFVEATVTRYSAPPYNIRFFQIWNEPTPQAGFWKPADGGDADQEFVDEIYIPAAKIVRAHGGYVVFGGWPSSNGISELSNQILAYHNAWKYTDYLDVHYRSLTDWQTLYTQWIAGRQKLKGLWQTEIGDADNPLALTVMYLQFLYWSISPAVPGTADGGGWSGDANMYKLFWYAGWSPTATTQGEPPSSIGLTAGTPTAPALSKNGVNLAALASALDGGDLAVYTNYSGGVRNPPFPAAQLNMGFTVGSNRIVVAQVVQDAQKSYTLVLKGLPSEPSDVSLTSANGSKITQLAVDYSNGTETVEMTPGAGACYLQIRFDETLEPNAMN